MHGSHCRIECGERNLGGFVLKQYLSGNGVTSGVRSLQLKMTA